MSSAAHANPSLVALKTTLERISSGVDHFELLGVPRSATDEQVQAAFVSLARVLHPDLPALRGEHRDDATRAFQALTRARLTLSDPERRYEYIQTLPDEPVDARPLEPNPELARIQMHRARQLLQRRDWASAEIILRQADALFGEPFDSECRSELAWALYNNRANDELRRAEEARQLLDEVIEARNDAAAVAQAHYYMAIWCKLEGEVPKVKLHLDKCLAINDKHVEAQRELRLFERRRSTSTSMALSARTSSKGRRASKSSRRASSASIEPASTTSGEVRKVPLQKKPSLLERLFGKGT